MKPITIWIIVVVVAVAAVAVGLFVVFGGSLVQYRTLSGPIGIVQQGEPPTHGFLGVTFEPEPLSPPTVKHVTSGSGAAQAGIRTGDVVTAFDNQSTTTVDDVLRIIRGLDPGATVRVTIQRDDAEQELIVPLITFAELLRFREQDPADADARGDD